jgi:hypothetical protein
LAGSVSHRCLSNKDMRTLTGEIPHRGMAERLASRQMFHLDQKLGVTPLYIRRPRGLERSPRRGETLHFSEKLFPLITSKRDECRSSVLASPPPPSMPIVLRSRLTDAVQGLALRVTHAREHHPHELPPIHVGLLTSRHCSMKPRPGKPRLLGVCAHWIGCARQQ